MFFIRVMFNAFHLSIPGVPFQKRLYLNVTIEILRNPRETHSCGQSLVLNRYIKLMINVLAES